MTTVLTTTIGGFDYMVEYSESNAKTFFVSYKAQNEWVCERCFGTLRKCKNFLNQLAKLNGEA